MNSLFPHSNFPIRLDQKNENKVCWFKDQYDAKKYIARYNLKKKDITLSYNHD
jgi:hypothetical protein